MELVAELVALADGLDDGVAVCEPVILPEAVALDGVCSGCAPTLHVHASTHAPSIKRKEVNAISRPRQPRNTSANGAAMAVGMSA